MVNLPRFSHTLQLRREPRAGSWVIVNSLENIADFEERIPGDAYFVQPEDGDHLTAHPRLVYVFQDPEDKAHNGYTVECPSLPGCISEGDTVDEALNNIAEAMGLWLVVALEKGEGIPEVWPKEQLRQVA